MNQNKQYLIKSYIKNPTNDYIEKCIQYKNLYLIKKSLIFNNKKLIPFCPNKEF